MRCICNKCRVEVSRSIEKHITAEDGRILCNKCSVGVEHCSDRIKKLLTELDK